MGVFRYIKKVVDEFQTPNTLIAITHYDDLKRTSLKLYNEICIALKFGKLGGLDWVDVVLTASDVIEETTLMRAQIRADVNSWTTDIVDYYTLHDAPMMACAIGSVRKGRRDERKLSAREALDKFRDAKSTKPKDWAIEAVTKMYRLDYTSRREMHQATLDTARRVDCTKKETSTF